jgi:8-oxo-dGTP diphosphatase
MAIRVIACVIERDGRLLVCQRPPGKRHGGLWEFPGGKLKAGETPLAGARRELEEELGLGVTGVGPAEFAAADPGSRYRIEFVAAEAEGEPRALEHPRIAWLGEAQLLELPLAPADAAYARQRVVASLVARLRSEATPERAEQEKAYVKSDLEFLGAPVPAIRRAAVALHWAGPGLPHDGLVALVEELWGRGIHELRVAAVELLDLYADRLSPADRPFLERLIREAERRRLAR